MIYRRRALQRRLDELRGVLSDDTVNNLVKRLNRSGKDRLAAMWELIVLHGLSKCGFLQSEVELSTTRRPDILFEQDGLRFIADITAVSDEGLDEKNPYRELSQLIEAAKNKLKLPIGGLDLRIGSKDEITKRGARTILLLPPRKDLENFVNKSILPQIIDAMNAGSFPINIKINDGNVVIDITIDPSRSPYSSGGFAAYDVPTIKDRNPLYNRLQDKAEQLRGIDGITGVIVGDSDCTALSDRQIGWGAVSAEQIVAEFFRQFSSIDFVLLLSVLETRNESWYRDPPLRSNHMRIFVRDECNAEPELNAVFQKMIDHFPKPAMMPVNGALRAREDDYDLGHHGGYSMFGSNEVRIGLREFTEIFAGLRRLDDNGAKNVEASRKLPQRVSHLQHFVLHQLRSGRLPDSIRIIKTGEDDDDDWVEIRFGEIDPAIAPFR
jgi:hypothetical protein